MDDYFYKLSQRIPSLDESIQKALLKANSTTPATSITLSQLRALYKDITEESFPRMGDPRVEMLYILSIPFIAAFSNSIGTIRFYIMNEQKA